MSLKTELQAAIDYCNTKLTGKGAQTASTVYGIGDKIETIQTGGGFPDDDYIYINPYQASLRGAFPSTSLPSDITLDISKATIIDLYSAFATPSISGSDTLTSITLKGSTASATNFELFIARRANIEEIDGALDFSSINSDNQRPFFENRALVEVRFVQNSIKRSMTFVNSPLLSDDSVVSIVNGLATVSGKTLTMHSTVKDKITGGQISGITEASITSKGWTLA